MFVRKLVDKPIVLRVGKTQIELPNVGVVEVCSQLRGSGGKTCLVNDSNLWELVESRQIEVLHEETAMTVDDIAILDEALTYIRTPKI